MSYRMSDVEISIEACAAAIRAGDDPRAVLGIVATAAEERGRRRGVEERDELRTLLRAVRPLIREEFLGAGAMTERGWEKFLARVDAALAPRDSAPQPGITDEKIRELLLRGERDRRIAEGNNVAPRDSAPVCDCDAPMTGGHWSNCATRKPRDSGITSEWLTETAKDTDDAGFVPAMNPARICRCGVVTGGHVIHAPTCFMAGRK